MPPALTDATADASFVLSIHPSGTVVTNELAVNCDLAVGDGVAEGDAEPPRLHDVNAAATTTATVCGACRGQRCSAMARIVAGHLRWPVGSRHNRSVATRSALTVARLGQRDARALQRLLDADPLQNVYMRSELRHGVTGGDWWGLHDSDDLLAAVLAGSLLVPCIPRVQDASPLAQTACAAVPPRMMVGPREAVLALHKAMIPERPARDIRDPQPMLVVDRRMPAPPRRVPVRLARMGDLDALVVAAAAMHREEMGVDPMTIDASSWRARMESLVERGWSWVWMERGEVLFKAELSAWMPDAVQIQGVYTHPARRGEGVATAGLAALCSMLFTEVPACTLYVNHYNARALRLYQRLGFRHAGDFATVIY